ncbi:MAG: LPS export ABC transporter periplasmic protein LptC [Desulfosudaceae bacterium]
MAGYKKIRVIPLLVVLAGLAAAGYLYLRHPGLTQTPPARKTDITSVPDVLLTEIRQTTYENGRHKWRLTADSARLIREKHNTVMHHLDMTVFTSDGQASRINADRGTFFLDSGNAEIAGNVRIDNGRYEIQAATLQYREKKNILTTAEPVRIVSDSSELTGKAMVYDLQRREAVLRGNVTGLFDSGTTG